MIPIIEAYNSDKVQYPNISDMNHFKPLGLTFFFRTSKVLPLNDCVDVPDYGLFEITNISIVEGGMGCKDEFIYLCQKDFPSDPDFNLIKFNGCAVIPQ